MKHKKIGILSMQRIINYGSFMQALGLKLMIENLGYNVEFVDYHIGEWYSKQNIKNTQIYKKFRKSLSFIKPIKVSKETEVIQSQYNILGLDKKYHYRTKVDTLVIGSDEVFNYIQKGPMVGYSPELIGAHNKAKKVITYAASCGNLTLSRLNEYSKLEEFAHYIKRMSAISVRDKNTYYLVRDIVGEEPHMHLDPVLISDFSGYFRDKAQIRDYILIYGYTGRFTKEEGTVIRDFAKRNEKKILCLGGNQDFCDQTVYCNPLEVPSYFKHAFLVITDTFHGTIFSIITESNVVIIIRDGEEGNTNKLSFLIDQMGMQNKQWKNKENLDLVINEPINYEYIKNVRRDEQKRSIDYLRNSL